MNSIRSALPRRDFLAGMGAFGATLAAGNTIHAAETAPAGKRTICVFSKHLQFLDYDRMAEAAAEIGFEGVDLTVRPGGHVLPENVERDLPKAVKAVKAAGLTAPMMATAVTDPADPLTERVLKTAADNGISYYRLGYYEYDETRPIPDVLDEHRRKVEGLAELNAGLGLHGGYQNHAGTGVGSPVWDLWHILRGLDPRWVGVNYDIRHATAEGGNSWVLGLKLISTYIKGIVIKDFKWALIDGKWVIYDVPVGEGMVDFRRYFKLLGGYGFPGLITTHFEYKLEETLESTGSAMRADLRALKSLLAEAGLG